MALRETDIRTGLYTPGFFIAFGARELLAARKDRYPVSVITAEIETSDPDGIAAMLEEESAVLKSLGRKIREKTGDNSIVARVANNQVAALLPGLEYGEALEVASSIRTISLFDIGSPAELKRNKLLAPKPVGAIKVGVASTENGAGDISDLLRASQDDLEEEKVTI